MVRQNTMARYVDIELPDVNRSNLKGVPSWKEYNIILIPRDVRDFFPGYSLPFTLETDIGDVEAWVTSARMGTPVGDLNAGSYLCTPRRRNTELLSLSDWYNRHQELEPSDILRISYQSPSRYRLRVLG